MDRKLMISVPVGAFIVIPCCRLISSLRQNSVSDIKSPLGAMSVESPMPLPVERAIHKLGNDISLARRRRHISQVSLAERMGASLSTVRRMEKGDVRVPIHFFARALHVFGEIQVLEHLLDTSRDEIGLTLMDERLPKRVRSKPGGTSGAL